MSESTHPVCVDCEQPAPETSTKDALISTSFGWRLSRRSLAEGGHSLEWRCPECWRKHRAALTAARRSSNRPPSKTLQRPSTPPGGS
jgi:hypothetical protein